jgi:hypothetical protein
MQHVAFGQLLVSGIFVETVIALISKKKPVSVLHKTLVLEDIGPTALRTHRKKWGCAEIASLRERCNFGMQVL